MPPTPTTKRALESAADEEPAEQDSKRLRVESPGIQPLEVSSDTFKPLPAPQKTTPKTGGYHLGVVHRNTVATGFVPNPDYFENIVFNELDPFNRDTRAGPNQKLVMIAMDGRTEFPGGLSNSTRYKLIDAKNAGSDKQPRVYILGPPLRVAHCSTGPMGNAPADVNFLKVDPATGERGNVSLLTDKMVGGIRQVVIFDGTPTYAVPSAEDPSKLVPVADAKTGLCPEYLKFLKFLHRLDDLAAAFILATCGWGKKADNPNWTVANKRAIEAVKAVYPEADKAKETVWYNLTTEQKKQAIKAYRASEVSTIKFPDGREEPVMHGCTYYNADPPMTGGADPRPLPTGKFTAKSDKEVVAIGHRIFYPIKKGATPYVSSYAKDELNDFNDRYPEFRSLMTTQKVTCSHAAVTVFDKEACGWVKTTLLKPLDVTGDIIAAAYFTYGGQHDGTNWLSGASYKNSLGLSNLLVQGLPAIPNERGPVNPLANFNPLV